MPCVASVVLEQHIQGAAWHYQTTVKRLGLNPCWHSCCHNCKGPILLGQLRHAHPSMLLHIQQQAGLLVRGAATARPHLKTLKARL